MAIFIAATETFSRKNIGCSIPESLLRYQEVADKAQSVGLPVRGYISVVAGCPYEASLALSVKPIRIASGGTFIEL